MDISQIRRFQAAADSSGIVFRPDIFDCDVNQNKERKQLQFENPISKPSRIPQTKRLSSKHSALRRRSGRAGDVATLDDQIARSGGTTFTYEQLPHRLRISKQSRPVSSAERVIELTRANGYLLQELAYYKDIQSADVTFYRTVMDLHAELRDALKKRSEKRADAESTLLRHWNIDIGDGNIEDAVF